MTATQTRPTKKRSETKSRLTRRTKTRPQPRPTGKPAAPATTTLIDYEYTGIDASGMVRTGRLLSATEAEATQRIRRLGLRPTEVQPVSKSLLTTELRIPGFGPKVDEREIAVLSRQLATMVGAGVPLLRSLSVLTKQTENQFLVETLARVRTDVESGDSLSDSIARHPRVFDDLYVPMVRAGETAGALDEILAQLATTMERSVALRQKIRAALTYPIAVLVLITFVIAAMLIFVVPVFAGIYDDLGGELPLPTRILVGVSAAFSDKLPLTLLIVGTTTYLVRRWKQSENGRLKWDKAKLRLPLVGDLLHKSAIARLTRVLAVLNRSGVPVLEALAISAQTVGNAAIEQAVVDTRQVVRRGGSMGSQMADNPLFPPMVVQLVSIGEETGTLDEMLETVAASFEAEVESAVAGFASLIEPLLMAFIGVVVGSMVISLYLPMFRIVDLIQ